MRNIDEYFGPYGTLGGKRGGTLRSFFERVTAPFDLRGDELAQFALQHVLGVDANDPKCVYCGRTAVEWDHLKEAGHGGGHQIGNLVPACKKCNGRKIAWHAHLARLGMADEVVRRNRIHEYIKLVRTGHTLLTSSELQALERAKEKLFAAIEDVDRILEPAIARFKALHPPPKRKRRASEA